MSEIHEEGIPDALKERDRWLLWDASADTPRRPHWRGDFWEISWNDASDWHTFEEALDAASERDSWGIGFVIQPDDPFYVIDVDGPYDEEGDPQEWLPELDQFLDAMTYVERSPSGNGLHILAPTDPPDWWSDCEVAPDVHQGVDCLTNKFCTVTGDRLEGAGSEPAYAEADEWLLQAYRNIEGELPRMQDVDEAGSASDRDEWSEDAIQDALDALDPDMAHDEWIRIGFAVHDWDGGSAGKRLFASWSRDGRKFDSDAEREIEWIWNNANSGGGGVTVGTLVFEAQQAGWSPPKVAPDGGATTASSNSSQDPQPTDSDGWQWVRQLYDEDESGDARFEASELLLDGHSWRNLQENDVLYWYDPDEGVYQPTGEQRVRSIARRKVSGAFSSHDVNEIAEHIRATETVEEDDLGGPQGKIAVQNGVIRLDDRELLDHSPEYNFLSRLNTEFDPGAECPAFLEFLEDVVPNEDDRKKLQEFAGYTLMHWALPHHKALFIVGPEASGKSTFSDAIRGLHGEGRVASLSPQQMTQRFGTAELHGKWVNVRNDIPSDAVKQTGTFKEIVSGDPVKAEQKNKDPFMFKPTAKHIFAGNQLPDAADDDGAFYRRILLVAFPHTIPRPERDKQLDEKIERELSSVLNWALDGLDRLKEQGGFTGDLDVQQTAEKWDKWGHTADRFAQVCLKIGSASAEPVPKKEVYRAYQAFCEEQGMPCDMQQAMTRRLKTEHAAEDGRATVDGVQERCFLNVEFTNRGEGLIQEDGDDSPNQTGL